MGAHLSHNCLHEFSFIIFFNDRKGSIKGVFSRSYADKLNSGLFNLLCMFQLSDSSAVRHDTKVTSPFLIIGPGCVLYNWLEELETWGYFTVR